MVDYSKASAHESSESYENGFKIDELTETIYKDKDGTSDCKSCGKSFSIAYALNRHVKEKHTSESILSCSECDWMGTRPYRLAKYGIMK